MFADRIKENKTYVLPRTGILDDLLARWRDNRLLRALAEAGTRVFSSGKALDFRLGQGKYLALTGVRSCRVTCVKGVAWVTATGDSRDAVLTPGQQVTLVRQEGKVIISGRGEVSQVRVLWD